MIPIENDELNDLIIRIAQKEKSALEQLYIEMKGSIFGLALMYTKSVSDSDDIVQDTMLTVWNNADKYHKGSPKAWIITIARNISLKYIRERKRSGELPEDIPAEDFRSHLHNTCTVELLLKNLDEKEREIVMMYSYGFSHAEISEITGRPCATIRWKYRNALKKLNRIAGADLIYG